MYAFKEKTMSVNGGIPHKTFASFLRSYTHNPSTAPGFRLSSGLPSAQQPDSFDISQAVYGAHRHPLINPLEAPTHFARYPYLVASFNMASNAADYFKAYVRDTEDLYLPHGLAGVPPGSYQTTSARMEWPGESNHHIYRSDSPRVPFKVEGSPELPVPSVIPRGVDVDVSKYENLSYDEWYHAPTLYQSSSPSTDGYQTNSPTTPGEPFSAYSSNPHAEHETHVYTSNKQAFSRAANDNPKTTYTMPGNYWANTTYPDRAITSNNTFREVSPYTYPTYKQSEHEVVSPRSPDQDIEIDSQEPSEEDADDAPSYASSPSQDYATCEVEVDPKQRDDDLLLQMRSEGYTYRDIKTIGRFKEAESTLRGRYRVLTKDREDRVRKPRWYSHDESLLHRTVRYYVSKGEKTKTRHGRLKLPWKKISQRMRYLGSSYDFAPATCAKKWKSLSKTN